MAVSVGTALSPLMKWQGSMRRDMGTVVAAGLCAPAWKMAAPSSQARGPKQGLLLVHVCMQANMLPSSVQVHIVVGVHSAAECLISVPS
mmetsp:Transcript_2655/g.6783  ORF Transcript_2655/g.6783 Transcript_2655/m.6783 type:complete len:89 (+) Transcript_2655:3673-3939(+)